jgi:energy-coupling factor transporter ATP-binding protein EcfA2
MKFSTLDRAHPEGAARTLQLLFSAPDGRHHVLEILADSIETAHRIDPSGWGVTLAARSLRLNVGRGAALSLAKNQLCVALDWRELNTKTRKAIQQVADLEAPGRLKTAPHAAHVTLEGAQIAEMWPLIAPAHRKFVADAAHGFDSRAPQSPTWRDAHSPGVLQMLRFELERDIPSPSYALSTPEPAAIPIETDFDAPKLLQDGIGARGLSFPPQHLAAFFTALSTKGFVILSGPSGVGKTALATAFAALLPRPGQAKEQRVRLTESEIESGQIALSPTTLRYLPPLHPGETRAATIICDGAAHHCRLVGAAHGAHLQLRGAARKWLGNHAASHLTIETEWDDETLRPTFRFLPHPQAETAVASNHLFLPVRSDWRDEKPLLGYFNPLANRYEWTPFLRFITRAESSFRSGDSAAHFVIFDEMNLARVEWYFADLLSILEAGRCADGSTREPLRFDFDAGATGELPPRQLHLPPNLYFIGTINSDESTQTLSPKVLDRAWVLEAPNVDFSNYPPQDDHSTVSETHRQELLNLFNRHGQFATPDKALVAAQLEKFPARRDDLTQLNRALEESGAGFGFRVFDEILSFCAVGHENGFYSAEIDAFDAAVAFKVVPRLHGGRGQIEGALRAVLEWGQARNLTQTQQATRQLLARLERDGFLP